MDFPSTVWTVLRAAKDDPRGARDQIIRRYWEPVHDYARIKGLAPEDAEEITQSVFMHVCRDGFLEQADRAKGRFRSLIVAVTDNVIKMWWRLQYADKRKGRRHQVSLDDDRLREIVADTTHASVDKHFNRVWAANLLRMAMVRLEEESGRLDTPYGKAVRLHFLEGRSYEETAEALKTTVVQVRNYIFRGKTLLGDFIRSVIREYCGSQDEYEDELRDLQEFLSSIS